MCFFEGGDLKGLSCLEISKKCIGKQFFTHQKVSSSLESI